MKIKIGPLDYPGCPYNRYFATSEIGKCREKNLF